MRRTAVCLMLGVFAGTAYGQTPAVDALLKDAVASLAGASSNPAAAVERALLEERAGELSLAVGAIRLGYVKAKARMAQGRFDDAILVAKTSLAAAGKLPESVVRAPLTEPLEKIIRQARAAQDAPPADAGDEDPDAEEAAKKPSVVIHKPRGRNKIDWEKVFAEFHYPPFRSPRAQDKRAADDLSDVLDRLGESPRIASKVMVYPDDWEALTKRRERFADGTIYKGPEFRTADGEVRQTVMYDVSSLLHPVPDFTSAPTMDLRLIIQSTADRAALREASEIFTGYADDLAAGIPLLQFFGGFEEDRSRQTQSTDESRADLMRLIDQILNDK